MEYAMRAILILLFMIPAGVMTGCGREYQSCESGSDCPSGQCVALLCVPVQGLVPDATVPPAIEQVPVDQSPNHAAFAAASAPDMLEDVDFHANNVTLYFEAAAPAVYVNGMEGAACTYPIRHAPACLAPPMFTGSMYRVVSGGERDGELHDWYCLPDAQVGSHHDSETGSCHFDHPLFPDMVCGEFDADCDGQPDFGNISWATPPLLP